MSLCTFVAVIGMTAGPSGSPGMSLLRTDGRDIVDDTGQIRSMRGVNFGGWLMMETWIPGIEMQWNDHLLRLAKETGVEPELADAMKELGKHDDDNEHITQHIDRIHDLLKEKLTPEKYRKYLALFAEEPPVFAARDMDEILRRRFGDYGAAEVWNHYHNTWITETDFQLARAIGFNFVRIPFWYKWFESDECPYTYSEYGFSYLDKAVAWAKEQGIYVMLDFHGAAGCQSPWDHTGELSRAEFFDNKEFQKRTAALWNAIARRYKDEPAVFAYDLLNEPFSAKDPRAWIDVHDMIYRAIRGVDTNTIIIMEDGYKLEEMPYKNDGFFPLPQDMGWENVVYSFHFYSGADPEFAGPNGKPDHKKRVEEVLRIGKMEQKRCRVPIYIGEFSTIGSHPNDIDGMRLFLTEFNRQGWLWSPWTFKYSNGSHENSIWGLYQYDLPWESTPNIHRDSLQSILEVIAKLRTDNFALHQPYAQVLRECLAQPTTPAGK